MHLDATSNEALGCGAGGSARLLGETLRAQRLQLEDRETETTSRLRAALLLIDTVDHAGKLP